MSKKLIYLMFVVLALSLTTTVADADIADGLVAYWPLDEGTGSTTADLSGNGNNGTLGSPTGNPAWDSGKFGGALNFNRGEGDYVDCGNPPILDFGTGDWTVSAWINVPVDIGSDLRIFAKGGDSGGGIRYEMYLRDGSGDIKILVDDDNNKYDPDTDDHANLFDGEWHHIVGMRRDGTKLRVYVDAVNDGGVIGHGESTIPADYDLSGTSQANAYIGANWHYPDSKVQKFFHGLIDDVAVWNRALTDDEVAFLWNNGDGNLVPVSGDLALASNPYPDNEEPDAPYKVVLSWTPGVFANTHDVYFGESFEDVNTATTASGEYKGNQTETTYALGRLDFNQTYYWRVDEVNAPPDNTIFKSNIWSFTVEPFAYPIAGENIIATASSSNAANEGPENTVNGSGLDDNDLHSTVNTAMWLSSTIGPKPTWVQYELDRVYKLNEMLVWNYNVGFESILGFGFKDVTIEYSIDGADWKTLVGVPEFAQAPAQDGYAYNTTVDFGGVPAKYIRLTANSNWGGSMPQYGLSEVRFFYVPVLAREPDPASGTTDMDVDNVTLSWRAGREAASHEVYLSDSNQAVIDETIGPVSIPADSSYANYDTGPLDLDQTYYWKVNEVNEAETPNIWEGDVLNFTTREFRVVDDFENYNNFSPDRVFQRWIDGVGFTEPAPGNPGNGSGAALGHDIWSPGSPHYDGDIMEMAIVHGDAQSAPLYYDNSSSPFVSEIERTFDVAQDWTKYGIQTLVLYFYGTPGNTGQLYVKLNDSKVVYDGDTADIATLRWKQWNIDLALFGAGLQSVTKLSIGIDGSGASGTLYLDDIRLYRLAPEPPLEIFFEAEAADILGASWRLYDDPTASGGKHIGSEDGDGDDGDTAPGAEWVAVYNFTAPAAGVYTVVLRIQDAGSDSFWVRIPGATSQTHEHPDQPGTGWVKHNIESPEGVWQWEKVNSDDHSEAIVSWTLPAGAHTLEIAKREDGVYLDSILITK